MLSKQDLTKIIEKLHMDTETEMTRDDLERILDEELSKPEEQMDAELIREIVQLLEDGASEEERAEAWKQTVKKMNQKRLHPALRWCGRIAAVLVAVLGLSVLTYKTAEAFNWQLILRLMRPFAETFMLYSGEQPGGSDALSSVTYSDGVKADEPQQYTAAAEAPETLQGHPAQPGGMPERFAYLQGYHYGDDLNTTLTHVYTSDKGTCIFTLMVLNDEDQTASHQFEQTIEEAQDVYLSGYRVTCYYNSDDATLSACWTQDNARYSIHGPIDEAELAEIVEATMNK